MENLINTSSHGKPKDPKAMCSSSEFQDRNYPNGLIVNVEVEARSRASFIVTVDVKAILSQLNCKWRYRSASQGSSIANVRYQSDLKPA